MDFYLGIEKKWWFIIGVIGLITLIILGVQQRNLLLSPVVSKTTDDGCSIMHEGDVPMTPKMLKACNSYCNENFPGEKGCKDAIRNLKGVPSFCRADETCNKEGLGNNEVYPPESCKITKDSDSSFSVDMDCELCDILWWPIPPIPVGCDCKEVNEE